MHFRRARARAKERAKEEKAEKEEMAVRPGKAAVSRARRGNRLQEGALSVRVSTGPQTAPIMP